MFRAILATCFLAALAVPAIADSGDDLKAGIEASRRGEDEEAVRLYQHALALGDLAPREDARAHANIGAVLFRQHRYEAALAEFDAAVDLAPQNGTYRYYRGHVAFYLARFDAAAADFERAVALEPERRYPVIWLHLARAAQGQQDAPELARNAAPLAAGAWPAPVIQLYLGKLSPRQFESAARQGDADERRDQACESAFYLGAYWLEHRDRARGEREFRLALSACPPLWVEYAGAEAELAALR